jgi:hypothetical protein
MSGIKCISSIFVQTFCKVSNICIENLGWLIDWCLMPTLAVFKLYRGVKFFLYINLDTYKKSTIRKKTYLKLSIKQLGYQSSKWKFEFTGPNQILEFILYVYLNKNWKIYWSTKFYWSWDGGLGYLYVQIKETLMKTLKLELITKHVYCL